MDNLTSIDVILHDRLNKKKITLISKVEKIYPSKIDNYLYKNIFTYCNDLYVWDELLKTFPRQIYVKHLDKTLYIEYIDPRVRSITGSGSSPYNYPNEFTGYPQDNPDIDDLPPNQPILYGNCTIVYQYLTNVVDKLIWKNALHTINKPDSEVIYKVMSYVLETNIQN
jgi:hypothetical protein